MARLISSATIEPYLWAISLVCNVIGRIVSGLVGDRIGLVKAYVATTLLLTVVSWATWLVREFCARLAIADFFVSAYQRYKHSLGLLRPFWAGQWSIPSANGCTRFAPLSLRRLKAAQIALFETVREDPGSAQGWGCFACILVGTLCTS